MTINVRTCAWLIQEGGQYHDPLTTPSGYL